MIHQYYSKEKLDSGHSSGFKASMGTVVGTCLTGSANLNWDYFSPQIIEEFLTNQVLQNNFLWSYVFTPQLKLLFLTLCRILNQ